jgi:hypothetical protein
MSPQEFNPVALMALYSMLLAAAAFGAGLCLGQWLGERRGREEAIHDENLRRVLENQQEVEREIVFLHPGHNGHGPN